MSAFKRISLVSLMVVLLFGNRSLGLICRRCSSITDSRVPKCGSANETTDDFDCDTDCIFASHTRKPVGNDTLSSTTVTFKGCINDTTVETLIVAEDDEFGLNVWGNLEDLSARADMDNQSALCERMDAISGTDSNNMTWQFVVEICTCNSNDHCNNEFSLNSAPRILQLDYAALSMVLLTVAQFNPLR